MNHQIDTHVKIIFHSRPQPVSIKRSDVKIIDGTANDNNDIDIGRIHYPSQPGYNIQPPMPSIPIQTSWNSPHMYSTQETVHEAEPQVQPWCVVGARVRISSGITGVITKCKSSQCQV